ncbi:endo-1,4-beta-xylanase, partial [Streptomyces sp. NPDC005476]|uniref:endo-1,4-beta-xylanase n=1 Tax=Streptomyces sp. NPDC005476 TaxID=3156882 RepID=UPI003456BD34
MGQPDRTEQADLLTLPSPRPVGTPGPTGGGFAHHEGVYRMVKDFKARGVPLDCVGFQAHFG